jgi:hypothetical protein
VTALQSVLGYIVVHPWKALIFVVLGVYAISATLTENISWPQALGLLLIAGFVAVFDT